MASPFIAFALVASVPPAGVAALSSLLLLAGTLLILPEMIRPGGPGPRGEAVVPRPPSAG